MSRTDHHITGPNKKYRKWEREDWNDAERKRPVPRHIAIAAELDEEAPANVGGGLHSIGATYMTRVFPLTAAMRYEPDPLNPQDENEANLDALLWMDDEDNGLVYVSASKTDDDMDYHDGTPFIEPPSDAVLPYLPYAQLAQEGGGFSITTPEPIRTFPKQAPQGTTTERIRVYDLAREVGVDGKTMVNFLRTHLHEYVKSASSTVVRPVADAVLAAYCAPTYRVEAVLDENERIKGSMLADVEQFFH